MTKRKVSTSTLGSSSFISSEQRRKRTQLNCEDGPERFCPLEMLLCKIGRSSLDIRQEENFFSWDGRDAMLIASRRWRDRQEEMMLNSKSRDNGDLRRFLAVGGDVFTLIQQFKDVECSSNQVKEKLLMIGSALANIALGFVRNPSLLRLKAMFSPDGYEKFQGQLFEEYVKFALSIYDLEDFERMMNFQMFVSEFKSLSAKLFHVESDCHALAEGYLEVCNLSHIKEHDLGYLLWSLASGDGYKGRYPEYSSVFYPFQTPVRKSILVRAIKAMRNYVPLKEEHRMRLNLELLRGKSFHVLNTLILEVWKNIYCDQIYSKSSPSSEFKLCKGFDTIYTCLNNLVKEKQFMVGQLSRAVTFPLSYGVFGSFSDEVIDAITIADYERRIRGHQFISAYHILCAFLGTWIAPVCKAMIVGREGSTGPVLSLEDVQNISAYKVYKTSRDVADDCGSNLIELQHLLAAIVVLQGRGNYWQCKEPRVVEDSNWQNKLLLLMVRNCSSSYWKERNCYPKWDDPDVLSQFLPADCPSNHHSLGGFLFFVVRKLYDALAGGGFTLSSVRLEYLIRNKPRQLKNSCTSELTEKNREADYVCAKKIGEEDRGRRSMFARKGH